MRFFCWGNKVNEDTLKVVKLFVDELKHATFFLKNNTYKWDNQACFRSYSNLSPLFINDLKKFWLYRKDNVAKDYHYHFDTYIVTHLVRQILAKFFNVKFVLPKMTTNLRSEFVDYPFVTMREAFWSPFEKKKKVTPLQVTKIYEDLFIEYLQELKVKKMVKRAIKDWPSQFEQFKTQANTLTIAISEKLKKMK